MRELPNPVAEPQVPVNDGNEYKSLEDWLYSGIVQFGDMMSMGVDPDFKHRNPKKQGRINTRAGLNACTMCIKMLEDEANGIAYVELPEHRKNTLANYFNNSFIEFIHDVMNAPNERFWGATPEETKQLMNDAAIAAFKRAREDLHKVLNGGRS